MYLSSTRNEAPSSNVLLLDINIQCSRNTVMCFRVSDAKYSLIADVRNLTTDYFHLASNFHAFIFVIIKCVTVEMKPLPFPFHNFLCLPAVELVRPVWPAEFVAKHRKILRDLCSACPELVLWLVHYCWPCVEHSCEQKRNTKTEWKIHKLLFFQKLTHSCFKMKSQREKSTRIFREVSAHETYFRNCSHHTPKKRGTTAIVPLQTSNSLLSTKKKYSKCKHIILPLEFSTKRGKIQTNADVFFACQSLWHWWNAVWQKRDLKKYNGKKRKTLKSLSKVHLATAAAVTGKNEKTTECGHVKRSLLFRSFTIRRIECSFSFFIYLWRH